MKAENGGVRAVLTTLARTDPCWDLKYKVVCFITPSGGAVLGATQTLTWTDPWVLSIFAFFRVSLSSRGGRNAAGMDSVGSMTQVSLMELLVRESERKFVGCTSAGSDAEWLKAGAVLGPAEGGVYSGGESSGASA